MRLRQKADGYRAGMDAALLAAACDALPGQRVLEPGCGVGGALLAAATRRPEVLFQGVERDPAHAALAAENADLNGLSARVAIQTGDIDSGFRALGLPVFDAVMANPPFFDDPATLRAPHPAKSGAWMADGGLKAWTIFCLKAVREGGTITIIHRADRLADILAQLAPKAGSFRPGPLQNRCGVHPAPTGDSLLAQMFCQPPHTFQRLIGRHGGVADANPVAVRLSRGATWRDQNPILKTIRQKAI